MMVFGPPHLAKVLNLGDFRRVEAASRRAPVNYNLACFQMNIPEIPSVDCGAQKCGSLAMSRMRATLKNVVSAQ